ncbi:MAG: O-antigen ligase family protein, partial [Vicinamibacterales bacterium]
SNLATSDTGSRLRVRRTVPVDRTAAAGLALLLVVAPFEALRPLVRVPGQSLSTVETVLLAVFAGVAFVGVRQRTWPVLTARDVAPWALLVVVAVAAAVAAPAFRANALHMAARLGLASAVCLLTAVASTHAGLRTTMLATAFASGTLVATLVVADFVGVPGVASFLALFREGLASVGAQVRASGPFQYPTIASMYLEVTFALGLGLLVSTTAIGTARQVGLILLLALTVEAIVLTFTRSGLITVVTSLALVGALHWKQNGFDRTTRCVAAVALLTGALLLSSRSAEALVLRMTSETQGQWFSARVEAPSQLVIDASRPIAVPLRITNTGRATWDSSAATPIKLSYHWIDEQSDAVFAWEGLRTPFPAPVRPGDTVAISASVDAPVAPGRYRLVWDLEQETRLWFSTEPGAVLMFTAATVTGHADGAVRRGGGPTRMPVAAARPGRFVLWAAAARMWREHPLLGVGPDNFRLLYGRYASIANADPRVHSNNAYIELFVGMGLVGAGVLAWLAVRVAAAVRRCCEAGGAELGVAAACVAIAVHGLADSFLSFTGSYIVMAVAVGLASACPQVERHAHRV